MTNPQKFDTIRLPAEALSNRQIADELNFGECLSENDWLIPFLLGRVVAEVGCGIGLRTAYLSRHTHQTYCTDPDDDRIVLAKKTVRLNCCKNARVVRKLAIGCAVELLIIDTHRCQSVSPPILETQPEKLVVFGSLLRSSASEILDLGYRHQPQFHRAAVFSRIRGHHGLR